MRDAQLGKKGLNSIVNTLGEHFFFVIATIVSAGFHFLYSIVVKIYVEPIEYGMYSTCTLLQTYLAYLQLGTLNAFNRDYPQLIGAGKKVEAKKYRDTVFSFLLTIFCIAILLILLICYVLRVTCEIDMRYCIGYLLCAVIVGLTTIENFGNYRRRIDTGFRVVSLVTLLELLVIPLGLFLVIKIGYYSLYITSILTMLIGISIYYKKAYADISIGIDTKLLKKILLSGMPLLVNGLIWTVVNSIDKFVILGYIGTESLGIYSIAQNAFSYMVLIPSAMSQLFYVKMGKKYGETEDVNVLCKVSLGNTALLTLLTSLLALCAFYLLPVLVEWAMPQYSTGIVAAQILIIGMSIYAATLVNGNILTILKKNKEILKNSIYMCCLNVACSLLLVISLGRKIEYVAVGTATAYIFSSFITMYQVKRCTGFSMVQMIAYSVVPLFLTIVPGVLVYSTGIQGILGLLISLLVDAVIYMCIYGKRLIKLLKRG